MCMIHTKTFCLQVSGLPVADVMDTWTKQMGYPVLDLSTIDAQTKLTQQRFLLDPNANPTQPPSPLRSVIHSTIKSLSDH